MNAFMEAVLSEVCEEPSLLAPCPPSATARAGGPARRAGLTPDEVEWLGSLSSARGAR